MYHEIGALENATGMLPRFASVYIHDTENATSNRNTSTAATTLVP